ncbi:hypothetical protein CEXT_472801 [Caerostris extrusa]|uniref:Uncharacterized protein n=1 Tax=Caerostris extrusa TaxID=172846 RepID=A0AAV4X934_CAEEX|nr:hypothetical protein CEXT_472801 [Caerostris extrusa]
MFLSDAVQELGKISQSLIKTVFPPTLLLSNAVQELGKCNGADDILARHQLRLADDSDLEDGMEPRFPLTLPHRIWNGCDKRTNVLSHLLHLIESLADQSGVSPLLS